MAGIFQEAIKELTEIQINFLCYEFGLNNRSLFTATEEQLDDIYDALCDIEVDETIKAGNHDLSKRGQITSDIVTTLGNAIAAAEGYFDEDDNA